MESGLVSGFSAVVPTDDYWRAKNEQAARRREQIQLGTAEQRRRDAERKRQEQEMKQLGSTYSAKVDPALRDEYIKKQNDLSKKIFDTYRLEQKLTPEILSYQQEQKNLQDLYEGQLSKNIQEFRNQDPNKLDEYGRFIQRSLAKNNSFQKISEDYNKIGRAHV